MLTTRQVDAALRCALFYLPLLQSHYGRLPSGPLTPEQQAKVRKTLLRQNWLPRDKYPMRFWLRARRVANYGKSLDRVYASYGLGSTDPAYVKVLTEHLNVDLALADDVAAHHLGLKD